MNRVIKTTLTFSFILVLFSSIVFSQENTNFKKGEDYYLKGMLQIAKVYLEKALQEDTTNYLIYYYLGNIYFYENSFSKSVNMYKTCLEFGKLKKYLLYNLGNAYYKLKEYYNAINYLKLGEQIDPSFDSIPLLLGFTYFKLKDKENSIRYFRKYIAITSNSTKKQQVIDLINKMLEEDFEFPEDEKTDNNKSDNSTGSDSSSDNDSTSSSNDDSNDDSGNESSSDSGGADIDGLIDDIAEGAGDIESEGSSGEDVEGEEDF